MWSQRSRALWIKCGDRNTNFFHETATQRQRKNRIEGLWGANGKWQEEKETIEEIIVEYFEKIYGTEHRSEYKVNVEDVESCITPEMTKSLLESFKAEEIRCAINQMHPTKSPGPDSMSPLFYQKYWDVVGPFVTKSVLQILNSGRLPCVLNETYICLIPKVQCPQKVTEFRPTSLCNIIYKIVSKVLANKLKRILPKVIGEAQSAFVLGRQISDNVFVTFETMHNVKMKGKEKKGLMAVKLDMSKAYNRVE